ncbi:MAG TPA: recombinase family protein [Mycobacteriales bacterium]|nr:recombinase family protein [Mycobacteriales bacterium]
MIRAGIYVRISRDKLGAELGVERQEADCRALAARKGWTVAEVYADNDVSASSGRRRPAFEQMLTDLDERKIDAVVVYNLDRLLRRVAAFASFHERLIAAGAAFATTEGDDSTTAGGRGVINIKLSIAQMEAERLGERVRREKEQAVERGRWRGGRTGLGYRPAGGTLEIVEEEAAEVRWAVEQIIAGASLNSVVRAWNDRGVGDRSWSATQVKRTLIASRLAALIDGDGTPAQGGWPPIITEDELIAVRAVLLRPGRATGGRPHRWLLSSVARCHCGAPMRIWASGPAYSCRDGHGSRKAEPVDAYVAEAVLARLERGDVADLFAVPADDRTADLRAERDELRARLDAIGDAIADGLDPVQGKRAIEKVQTRLAEVDAAVVAATTPSTLAPFVTRDPRAVWEGLDVKQRRAVVAALVDVTFHPAKPRAADGSYFDADAIKLVWRA